MEKKKLFKILVAIVIIVVAMLFVGGIFDDGIIYQIGNSVR